MTKSLAPKRATKLRERTVTYENLIERITQDVNAARHLSARAVNAVMMASYWLVGRHIVGYEQAGAQRAECGEELLARLSRALSEKLGRRGFAKSNLSQMRAFYLGHEDIFQTPSGESAKALPASQKAQTPSAESQGGSHGKGQTVSGLSLIRSLGAHFPLPWSAYEHALSVKDKAVWCLGEAEALHRATARRGLDTAPAGDYIKGVICSPLDLPKGLRRGFAFRGFPCQKNPRSSTPSPS
jgi:hypothetical protein